MDNSRRVLLYRPRYIQGVRNSLANTLAEARADLHDMHFKHLCELADLRREIGELRSILGDVVTTLRTQAESDVATLRRQLETALAKLDLRRLRRRRPSCCRHLHADRNCQAQRCRSARLAC